MHVALGACILAARVAVTMDLFPRKIAIVSLIAGLAAAQAPPVGEPSGNPFTRPLNEIVPACKPYTITWQPTTPNSISLILLRGPSTNIVPITTIAVRVANSGSLVWTPASSLEADSSRYGIQLIDDVTGQYQYSSQFGISKGPECISSSNAATSASRPRSSSSPEASSSSSAPSSSSFITSASTSPSPLSSISSIASAPGPQSSLGTSVGSDGSSATDAVTVGKSRSGLSTGAKGGIGVAVPLATLLLAGMMFLLWRKKRKTVSSTTIDGHKTSAVHSGLMVPAYESSHDPMKAELDSTTTPMSPPHDPMKAELDSTITPSPPVYTHHQPSHTYEADATQIQARSHQYEMPTGNASPSIQPSELSDAHRSPDTRHSVPADVGPAIVVPAPYRDDNDEIQRLEAQRAAIARERERKEEIERMKAEEDRLEKAIAELRNRQR